MLVAAHFKKTKKQKSQIKLALAFVGLDDSELNMFIMQTEIAEAPDVNYNELAATVVEHYEELSAYYTLQQKLINSSSKDKEKVLAEIKKHASTY